MFLNSKILWIKYLNFFVSKKLSIVIMVKDSNMKFVQMPQIYYTYVSKYINKIMFTNKNYFISFYNIMKNSINELLFIRSVKLFIRGLGFRVYSINNWVYNIIFNWINNIYMYCSVHVIMRVFRKKIILLSKKWYLLKNLMFALLGLKRLGPYEMRGLKTPRSFLLKKKPRKKNALR